MAEAFSSSPVKSDLRIHASLQANSMSDPTVTYSAFCNIRMESGSKSGTGTVDFHTGSPTPVLRVKITDASVSPEKDEYYKYILNY